jgi:predicted MPP superfamily phosphohydrolase
MTTQEKVGVLIFLGSIALIYGVEFLLLVDLARNRIKKKPVGRSFLSKPAIVVHCLALVGVVCFLYAYFVEPYWIEVNTIPIETEKLKAASVRIVQISDLHCDKKARNEEKVVEIVNSLNPDIVVFTGDSLNTAEALGRFKDTLSRVKAGMGKYAVNGNFEMHYWGALEVYKDTGFELLDEEVVKLEKDGEVFYISGLSFHNPPHIPNVLKKVPDTAYSVFLHHVPCLVEDIGGLNADLYLCGHTHGGQVALPFYGALTTLSRHGKKYERGMYEVGHTKLYVNRGIGMEGGAAPRVRFCSRPEITVFDIGPKDAKSGLEGQKTKE